MAVHWPWQPQMNFKRMNMMPLQIRPDDPRITWQGAISFQHTDQWIMPWRIPYDDRALFPPSALRERASMPAGVRLAFQSDTQMVAGHVETKVEPTVDPIGEPGRIDLYCDGQFHGSLELAEQETFKFQGLPPGEKLIELWLPQYGQFRLRGLELTSGSALAPYEDPRPRWVTYGSSITHCRAAESPSQTWPAITARKHGLNLTCLGYGGNCHLEPMVARLIRDLPADFLSMKVGINIYGSGSLNARTFIPAIIGFVQIIREKHPDTPFAVISPIFSPPRESTPNAVGFTLAAMREEVAEAVQIMKGRGDRNIHYIDGLTLFGADLAGLLPDELHPNAEGYRIMGQNFLENVAAPLFKVPQHVVTR